MVDFFLAGDGQQQRDSPGARPTHRLKFFDEEGGKGDQRRQRKNSMSEAGKRAFPEYSNPNGEPALEQTNVYCKTFSGVV